MEKKKLQPQKHRNQIRHIILYTHKKIKAKERVRDNES